MLLTKKCQTHCIIQAFLGHSLLFHYCIHLPDCQCPLLGPLALIYPHLCRPSSVSTIRDFALSVPIFPPSLIIFFLQFPSPHPLLQNLAASSRLLKPQLLFPPVCTDTSALSHPTADLSFLSYADKFPKKLMESATLL